MKNFSLLLIFLIISSFSFAQEFTPPDSAAIVKNHVKSVQIYYTGTGTTHLISQEYHYDKKGRIIFSRTGTAKYYYTSSYNEKNEKVTSIQREENGTMIRGFLYEYAPSGKMIRVKLISAKDSIHPSSVFTYDAAGNKTGEEHFISDTLISAYYYQYDAKNKFVHMTDSFPGKFTEERNPRHITRTTFYNEKFEMTESREFVYCDLTLCAIHVRTPGKNIDYKIVYTKPEQPEVYADDKLLNKKELESWRSKFGSFLYVERDAEDVLPYADPVSKPNYIHTLKKDKAGNIKEDVFAKMIPKSVISAIGAHFSLLLPPHSRSSLFFRPR